MARRRRAYHSRSVLTAWRAVARARSCRRPSPAPRSACAPVRHRAVAVVLDPAAEAHRVGDARAAGTPTGCRRRASRRAARPGGRRGCAARTCRTRSGCRSRTTGRPSVAIESRKQAASRPRPPLPSAGVGLLLDQRPRVDARCAASAAASVVVAGRARRARCRACGRSGTPSTGSRRRRALAPRGRPLSSRSRPSGAGTAACQRATWADAVHQGRDDRCAATGGQRLASAVRSTGDVSTDAPRSWWPI